VSDGSPTAHASPAPGVTFDPSRFRVFRFVASDVDESTCSVVLRYALDDEVLFTETVRFAGVSWPQDEPRREALRRLARLLHLLAGVSYFKTAAPAEIAFGPGVAGLDGADAPSPRLRALLRDVYTLGLGEFAYTNDVDVRERGALPAASAGAPSAPVALPTTGRTLVPIGGGKDSVVALEVVLRSGREALPFSVGRAAPIERCVAVSGLPHAVATRALSPNIGALNASGALNGHVPVTAVVSTIALMTAVLHGADAVAMANERSASEGNLVWNGLAVNHQWSKGSAFESALRELVESEVATGLDYRSVLRPASELAIARAFAGLPRYHAHFTSCNTVFRLDPERRNANWCGDCPKCRFVFLALAPSLDPDALSAIFGVDMLADATQYDGFADLAGLREHKPFECVGEEAESLLAMRLIAEGIGADGRPGRDAWIDHAVVARLRDEHLTGLPPLPPDVRTTAPPFVLDPAALQQLPADLRDAVADVLGAA
jgi:UDP-N-acetyl-alpha-D-muramoyl-L-alanyl-L-glutamate epimerase